jgi:hypothetical protein
MAFNIIKGVKSLSEPDFGYDHSYGSVKQAISDALVPQAAWQALTQRSDIFIFD